MTGFRKYTLEDAEYLKKYSLETAYRENDDYTFWAEVNEYCGPALTYVIDDIPIYCIGICLADCNCGRFGILWGVFSSAIKEHKKELLKSLRIILDIWFTKLGMSWVWAMIGKDFKQGETLLKHFGFVLSDKENETFNFYYFRNKKCLY